MKICFVTNGNSIHSIRWIQPVIDANHDVYVISYTEHNLSFQNVRELINLPKITNHRKVRFLSWGLWLRNYIHHRKPDILHAHQIQAAGWICALTGFHPFLLSTWGSDLLIENQISTFRRLLAIMVLSRTDYLTVPSKMMYDAARKHKFDERKLYLIPWGIETGIFKPYQGNQIDIRRKFNIPPNAPVILSPRAIHPIYNQDIVIKSCQAIKKQFPDLKLILLKYNVNPDYFKQLERLIVSCDMETSVIWLPAQESLENMAFLYQLSDVVLSIPSSEGYGFSVYESVSSGTPTVITDLPVFQEDLQNEVHVLKVPLRDAEVTAEALMNILSNPELRLSLAENCILKSSDYGVQARIDMVEDLYSFVMARNQ